MGERQAAEARERRRERNRRHHESLLLRLEPGGRAPFDEAARALGVSRSACARLLLPALMGTVAPRLAAIEAARALTGQSLGRFLALALDEALARSVKEAAAPPPAAAAQFDELFGAQP